MNLPDPPLDLTVRVGLEFVYRATQPTPIVLLIRPRLDSSQHIEKEQLNFSPHVAMEEREDQHGNLVQRFVLPVGDMRVRHDAFISVPSLPENTGVLDEPIPIAELPFPLLRYTLPSRYCDSDKLRDFAFDKFGQVPHGLQRVHAICDWLHANMEYRWGSGSATTTASESIAQGFGVCRDFAHAAIALCRAFNLPARYVVGHVPDITFFDSGSPMDFHAYFQVYIGGRWLNYDARFNVPRIGRIRISSGLDAVDGAFSTLYGAADLTWFSVWSYQVDPREVDLGDPIDLSKRLCGTPELRFSSGKSVV